MSSMKNQINEVIKEDVDESIHSGKTEKGQQEEKDDEYEDDFVEASKQEDAMTEHKMAEGSIKVTPNATPKNEEWDVNERVFNQV